MDLIGRSLKSSEVKMDIYVIPYFLIDTITISYSRLRVVHMNVSMECSQLLPEEGDGLEGTVDWRRVYTAIQEDY